VAEGDTFDARDDVLTGCGSAGAADVMFRVDLLRKARFSARIRKEEGKHQIAVQSTCGVIGTELECGNAVDRVLPPGSYWVVVESAAKETFGRFELGYSIQDVAAAEGACSGAVVLTPGRSTTGSISGAGNRFTSSCAGPADLQAGPDRVHKFTLAKRAKVGLQLRADAFQPVMSIRQNCLESSGEMGCQVGSGGGRPVEIERVLEPGTYFVVVDGKDVDSAGDYTLDLKVADVP
jgi:hypothetical protein